MECNVCEQQKAKLYCNKCVKEGIRQQSYQHHAVSRKKDEALEKVKTYLASDSRHVWTVRAERDEKKLVISLIRQEIERLQVVIRKERQRLENVKGEVATRKSNLASAIKGIKAGYAASATSLKAEIARVKERRDVVHQSIAVARRSRCKEAAELLGLRRFPTSKEDAFAIASIVLVDLNLIRSKVYLMPALTIDSTPTYVMLGISHITHLLTLFTDYLSLKLPYEIIPPSRGISYPCIRKSSTTKPLALTVPPDPSHPSSPHKAWQGKKFKDLPQLDFLLEAMSLLAWDIAWVLWTQQLWPPIPEKEQSLEACRLARNLYMLVTSPKIGRMSHASTIEFLPTEEAMGRMSKFDLTVKEVQDVVSMGLQEDKVSGGDVDGGGWDMVEGGEEVIRGDGWLKLPPITHSQG